MGAVITATAIVILMTVTQPGTTWGRVARIAGRSMPPQRVSASNVAHRSYQRPAHSAARQYRLVQNFAVSVGIPSSDIRRCPAMPRHCLKYRRVQHGSDHNTEQRPQCGITEQASKTGADTEKNTDPRQIKGLNQ